MEAAIRASERGHKVILFEAGDRLGGQLHHADFMDFRADMKRFKDFQICQVKKDPNIEIRMNTKATPQLIAKEKPDGVIVAIGSKLIVPRIPGMETNHVIQALDIFGKEDTLGDRIVIIGGGSVGCETSIYLANLGKKDVTVVEMGNILLPETMYIDRYYTLWFMEKEYNRSEAVFVNETKNRQYPVKSLVKNKCTGITKDGVLVTDENGAEKLLQFFHLGYHNCKYKGNSHLKNNGQNHHF